LKNLTTSDRKSPEEKREYGNYSDQKQGVSRRVAEAQGNNQTGEGQFIIIRFKKSN